MSIVGIGCMQFLEVRMTALEKYPKDKFPDEMPLEEVGPGTFRAANDSPICVIHCRPGSAKLTYGNYRALKSLEQMSLEALAADDKPIDILVLFLGKESITEEERADFLARYSGLTGEDMIYFLREHANTPESRADFLRGYTHNVGA